MKAEEWRKVPGHPGIWASSLGRIKSDPYRVKMPRGRGYRTTQIKPTRGKVSKADKLGNYFRMHIEIKGKTHKVHRLVCAAFHGKPKGSDDLVLHLNDDGLCNRQSNLKWGTQYENLNSGRFRDLMSERTEARVRAATGRFA